MSGTASSYDIRYSTSPITEENWAQATQCEGEPRPQPAGSTESFTVTGLQPGVLYYFGLKATDDAGNTSDLSNIAQAEAKEEHGEGYIHPRLLFDADAIGGLRQKVQEGEPERLWEILKAKADSYLDLDPTKVREYANQGSLTNFIRRLAFAYVITGEEEYGDKAVALLVNWATDRVDEYPYYPYWEGRYHNIGDILVAVALGYDWTYDLMTEAQRDTVRSALTELAFGEYEHSYTSWWGTGDGYNNWTGAKAGGFGLAGLAIYGESGRSKAEEDSLLQRAKELVSEYFEVNFGTDGEAYEGILYGGYGLKNAVTFAAALKRLTGEDIFSGSNAAGFIDHLVYALLPDRSGFNQLNNSKTLTNSAYTSWMMTALPENGLARWLWTNHFSRLTTELDLDLGIIWYNPDAAQVEPSTQLPSVKDFRTRGLVYFRSGWQGEDDIVSSFDAKQMRVIEGGKTLSKYHLHEDVTNFTLYAYGGRFAVPPGYEYQGSNRTEAHNNVLIDGQGQTSVREGRLLDFITNDIYTLAVGDASASYPDVERAVRYYAMVNDSSPYFICVDDIQKDESEHTYEWLLQTDAENTVNIGPNRVTITSPNSSELSLNFVGEGLEISVDPQEYVYSTGNAKRLRVKFQGVNPYFFVVMVPRKGDMSLPQVTGSYTSSAVGAKVVWGSSTSYLLFRKSGSEISEFDVQSDAKMVMLKDDGRRFLMYDGTTLKKGGMVLVDTYGTRAKVSVYGDVEIFGEGIRGFKVYAPEATVVKLNGSPVSFVREGDYIVYGQMPEDTTPPTVLSVKIRSSRTVQIVFSEPVDRTSAENISNYTINNGIEVRGASLEDSTTVYLTTDDHAQGTTYTLRVSNIRDLSGNTIEPNTSKSYTFDPIMIWLEAEEGALTPPMQAASDSSASGGSYIHAPSGGYRDGRAEYTIEIPQDGDYIIWGRVLAPDVGRNSFFVSFDEDQDDIWDCLYEGQSQDWTWDQVTWRGNGSYDAPQFDPVVFHLNSGTHTLIIKERESGTKLDKLLLTNDFSFVPTDAHRDTIPPAPPTGLKVTWH